MRKFTVMLELSINDVSYDYNEESVSNEIKKIFANGSEYIKIDKVVAIEMKVT